MTLNPVKHFDPIGAVMFAIAHFGWAKPVPINPYNFNNYKKGCFWTSAAGVLTNYAMAFLFYPILIIGINYLLPIIPTIKAQMFIFYLLTYLLKISFALLFKSGIRTQLSLTYSDFCESFTIPESVSLFSKAD